MGALATFLIGLLTLFVAWAASQIYFKRRLFLVVPRLFDYSDLSAGSKTVELLVLNSGKRPEEEIEVRLAPAFDYQVIAATQSALAFDGEGVLRIPRLAPGQEVSLVFLAEGSEQFKKDHILEIASKNTKGKVKNSVADAQQTPGGFVVALLVLLIVMGIGYLFFGFLVNDIWPWAATATGIKRDVPFSMGCHSVSSSSKDLKQSTLDGLGPKMISVSRVYRQGQNVYATVDLKNPLEGSSRINFSVEFISPAVNSEERDFPSDDHFIYDNVLFAGQTKQVIVGDRLPKDFSPQKAFIEVTAKVDGAVTLWDEFDIAIDRSSAPSCKGSSDKPA